MLLFAITSVARAAPPPNSVRSPIQPVIFKGTQYTVIHFQNDDTTDVQLLAMNDAGQAVGASRYRKGANLYLRAVFLDTDHVLYELPPNPEGSAGEAWFIDDNGIILAWNTIWFGDRVVYIHRPLLCVTNTGAALYYGGIEESLDSTLVRVDMDGHCESVMPQLRQIRFPPRVDREYAVIKPFLFPARMHGQGRMNDAGAVIGYNIIETPDGHYGTRASVALLSADGSYYDVVDLGALGGLNSTATCMNKRGDVAGEAQSNDGDYHPFIATRRGMQWTMRRLEIGGASRGAAISLNDFGVAVGTIWNEQEPTAVIWERGKLRPLNELIADSDCKLHIESARHITNAGHILATVKLSRDGLLAKHYHGDGQWLARIGCDTVILKNPRMQR